MRNFTKLVSVAKRTGLMLALSDALEDRLCPAKAQLLRTLYEVLYAACLLSDQPAETDFLNYVSYQQERLATRLKLTSQFSEIKKARGSWGIELLT